MIRLSSLMAMCIVVVAAVVCACSENRGDPLAAETGDVDFGGSLSSGGNLANADVTGQNWTVLCDDVFWLLYRSYVLALSKAGQAAEIETIRIQGDFNGYAVVEAQPISVLPAAQKVLFDCDITYYDWSADGRMYMGGKISYTGTWAEVNNVTMPVELRMDGGVAYAGAFAGTLECVNFKLGIDSEGALIPAGTPMTGFPAEGNIIIVSNENQMTVYPYPVR